MSDLLEELRAIVEKLSTQPNAATSDPYYTVQQKVKDWGIDPDYHESTGHAWVLDGEEIDDPTKWCAENDEGPFDPDDPPDGMRQVWYRERWEHVHAFLTQDAALAFMKREAHNHGPMRTWVESACRNREMRWVCALPARALEAIATAERERDEARAEVERLRALFATPDALHQVACAACGAVELADCICSECCDICGHTDAVCMCDRRERCLDCGYARVECACADESEEGGDHG